MCVYTLLEIRAMTAADLQSRPLPGVVLDGVRVVLTRCWAFVLVGLAFVLFVYLNGGIVLGDKSNHQVGGSQGLQRYHTGY